MSTPIERIRDTFDAEVKKYGKDPRACYWRSEGSQWKRFELMVIPFYADIFSNTNISVVDVGCGQGDLLGYLIDGGFEGKYFGVDVSPEMIQIAEQRIETDFKELKQRPVFRCKDFMTVDINEKSHDFVFASGIWNMHVWNSEGLATLYAQKTITKMFQISKNGIAFNMLSVHGDWYNENNHYYEPLEILKHALNLSRNVVFRHDYAPHDFTVIIKPNYPLKMRN